MARFMKNEIVGDHRTFPHPRLKNPRATKTNCVLRPEKRTSPDGEEDKLCLGPRGSLDRAIANSGRVCIYVRLSVRPSVTLVIHAETVQDTETHFALHDRAMFLVS